MREALGKISDGLLVNPDKTAVSTLQLMPSESHLIENINPSTLFKSIKSAADLDHVREAIRQDGAALCGFFAEFERNLADGTAMNELDIDTMLHKYRSARHVIHGALELGILYLSAYAFSTKNWKRSPEEVRYLIMRRTRRSPSISTRDSPPPRFCA